MVYISGPLQAAADLWAAREFYEFLAHAASSAGWQPYLPHQVTDPTHHRAVSAEDVFHRDRGSMARASAILAHIGPPSSGVGAELGIAFQMGLPIIGVHAAFEAPSRFIVGMLSSYPKARLVRFKDRDECQERVVAALRDLREFANVDGAAALAADT